MFSLKRPLMIIATIASLYFLAAVVVSQQAQDRNLLNESKPYKRWEWAYEQRAYPRKEIPDDALELGWRRLQRWRDLPQRKGSFRAQGLQPSPGRWVNIGPAPILDGQLADANQRRPVSGRVSDIAVDPTNPNRWLIGAAQGGVWETRDAGATWTPLTDNQISLSIGAVAFTPTNPQIIYAGTGEAVFSGSSPYAGVGLLRSVNGGGAWQLLAANQFKGLSFSDIKIDPGSPGTLLAAVTQIGNPIGQTSPSLPQGGVFKSTDSGVTWTRTLSQNNFATDLESDPNDFNRQYAALGRNLGDANNGTYRSVNAGNTWALIDGPWRTRAGGVGRIELAIAPSNPNVLYVSVQDAANGTANDNWLLGIWKTENAWASPPVWAELTPNASLQTGAEAQWFYDHELSVDPNNPNILYVGGVHLWRCSDTTARPTIWEQLDNRPNNAIHVDQHTMTWTQASAASASTALNHQPMNFEVNQGQSDERVKFLARGQGYSLFLTANEAVLQLQKSNRSPRRPRSAVVRMKMVGANKAPRVASENPLPGKSNYFIGNDPKRWLTSITNYEKVRYYDVWPGIDLAYYGKERQLEYDFIVAPGANPKRIKLGFSGVRNISISRKGDLVLRARGGKVRLLKPQIYQEVNGVKKQVRGRYVRRGKRQIGFRVGAYDRRLPLVIDPVLVYSSYLGGNGGDYGQDIAVDAAGNAYVTGYTGGGFPASRIIGTGGSDPGFDIFVTKFNATGTGTLYSTIIRGNRLDLARSIAVDGSGNAYLTGETQSTDFPTVNAFQTTRRGLADAFVAKLNPSGSALVYSSYLGGATGANGEDAGSDIEVDELGHAWVTGTTDSSDFTTVNPIQTYPGRIGASGNAFVTELDPSGRTILFSTYLGGTNFDGVAGIAIGQNGNVYVTGSTDSTDFKPAPTGYQKTLSGSFDAFVVCIRRATHTLVYSTYLGGSASDGGSDIAVDSSGNAYVTGSARSTNFPVKSALQANLGGIVNAFITKLLPNGSDLVYSTYFGSITEEGQEIAVDAAGNCLVAGVTSSNNLTPVPNPNPIQPGGFRGRSDAFVLKLNPAGNSILFLTYFGGSDIDVPRGMAVDSAGRNVWLSGETQSINFPTTAGVYQASHGGGMTDAFVAKMDVEVAQQQRRLIVGNDGGVWSTTNGGQAWADHNTNLAITQFYSGSLHSADENQALGGSQDNGSELWTGTIPWRRVLGGDGAANAFSSANPNAHWMVSSQFLDVRRTRDGGATTPVRVDSGIEDNVGKAVNRAPFIAPCEKCPNNNDVFIGGTDNVWRSDNFFSASVPTWSKNGPDMGVAITALAFAPDSGCDIYAFAAANSQLWLTVDGGVLQNWRHINAGGRLPNRRITDLAFHPLNPDVLYVTLSGFDESTPAQPGHVFKTENARAATPAWVNVSPPVNIPHNTIAIDPANPRIVYLGTDMGVWKSSDEGVTWEHFGPDRGMPNITVNDIRINEGTGRIVAFTHGRGAFAFDRGRADLAVTMTDIPDPVVVNQNLTYRLTVRNNGPDRATEIYLLDTLPTGVTLISATASQGTCAGSASISCFLGALSNGASATVTIIVRPAQTGAITNQARVSSYETDPNGANNTASVSTQVTVSSNQPTITSITPSMASPGASNLELKIEGAFFQPGAVISFSPAAGIEVLAVSPTDPGFIGSAEIRRRINVQSNAPLGDRQMFVTNPNGSAGGVLPFNRFTVVSGVMAPNIEITPASLSFGDLVLGAVKGLTVACRNTGNAPLMVYEIRSGNPHFASSTASFSLDPGITRLLSVSFTPTAAGAQAGEMIFSSNAPGKTTVAIPLRGSTPGTCMFTVTPDNLSFSQSGGLASFDVATQSGCEWMIADPPSWILDSSFPLHIGSGSVVLQASNSTGPRTAMVAVAGRTLTVRQAEQVASVSAASFSRTALAGEAMTAAFGQNMATSILIGDSIPLPTNLGGTTLKVRDSAGSERLAPLFFVSPGQINYQIPPGTTTGEAIVTVTSGNGQISMGTLLIEAVAPGLFTANSSGLGVAAAVVLRVKADGTQVYEEVARFDSAQRQFVSVPIDLGPATDQLFLIMFGTGWRNRSALDKVVVKIGGLDVQTLYAGEQGGFVGLDQLNLPLPRSLASRGEVEIQVTVDGRAANIVRVNVR